MILDSIMLFLVELMNPAGIDNLKTECFPSYMIVDAFESYEPGYWCGDFSQPGRSIMGISGLVLHGTFT